MEARELRESCGERRERTDRDALLDRHMGLVHHVARQLHRRLSSHVEFADLVSAGTIGLMHALEGYDARRGTAFSTYATPRIRGAILDELRSQDPAPRSIRRKSRAMRAARSTLRGVLGREPRPHETARELGIEPETLWRWEAQKEATVHVSFDPAERSPEPDRDAFQYPLDERPEAERRLDGEGDVAVLRDGLRRLPDRQRLVLTLYYYEGLKLREIATVLRVTESRVSQIRSGALRSLRRQVAERLTA